MTCVYGTVFLNFFITKGGYSLQKYLCILIFVHDHELQSLDLFYYIFNKVNIRPRRYINRLNFNGSLIYIALLTKYINWFVYTFFDIEVICLLTLAYKALINLSATTDFLSISSICSKIHWLYLRIFCLVWA